MIEHFKAGGWGMFPILIVGLIALGAAVFSAARGQKEVRHFAQGLSKAVFWMTLTAFFTDMTAVIEYVTKGEEVPWRIFLVGLGESIQPCVLGTGFLGLIALLVAIGKRREQQRLPV